MKKGRILIVVLILIGLGTWAIVSNPTTIKDNDVVEKDELDNDIVLGSTKTTITTAGEYVISGESDQTLEIDVKGNVKLTLNMVNINSLSGPAIYVKNADQVTIELANNSENSLTSQQLEEDGLNAIIYSNANLIVDGEGKLQIKSMSDGIKSMKDLVIMAGDLSIEAMDDGFVAQKNLNIKAGTMDFNTTGDAIKAGDESVPEGGNLTIEGGFVRIVTEDDAIKAERTLTITGANIDVSWSVEGLEAPVILIEAGKINIYATDDGINASSSDLVESPLSITIKGGNLKVEVAQGDTDAIDSNGDLTITGGIIELTGRSTIDFDGTGLFTGGQLILNGQEVTELPNQMMGPRPQR